jgi:hypothetical protein
MPNGPAALQVQQMEACNTFSDEIDNAIKDFFSKVYDLAKKHGWFVFSFSTLF